METTHEATASLRNMRGSARKARLLLDMIRGKNVNEAKNMLQFSTKRMAKDIYKLLNSAIANVNQATGKHDTSHFIVEKCWADNGRIQKMHMPRAQGRATLIRKRSCHVTIGISGSGNK